MAQLVKAGADLKEPRHVLYFLYLGNEANAEAAGAAARDSGYRVDVRPAQAPDSWALVAEVIAVLDPPTVIAADDFFQSLADSLQGDYDGWEASATMMTELPPH